MGRTNFLVTNYDDLVRELSAQNAILKEEKAELEKDVTRAAETNAELTAALETSEEKCSVLNLKCGYHPDNILLGDASLGGWKSRGTLVAELESSQEELRKYKDFEAVVAHYLADRDMSSDAISLLSESLGRLKTLAELKVNGALVLPEQYEAAKAHFYDQRALIAEIEVASLDVEDLLSDKARDFVLAKRAEQEKVRNVVKGDGSAQGVGREALVGADGAHH